MQEHRRTDLHGHSFLSDGQTSPEEFVQTRARAGLEVIALSDHDILTGVRRAAAVAQSLGLVLVPAMEVSAFIHFGTTEAEQVHVLAYFPPSMLEGDRLERSFLYQRGLRVLEAWKRFVLAWVQGLERPDRSVFDPAGDLARLSATEFPGLKTLLNRIVGVPEGVALDRARARAHVELRRPLFEAFHRHHVRFWTEDRELFGWSPEEMIDAIRADGALDVVAHPNRIRDRDRMAKVLDEAQGVEVYTSRHSETVAKRFLELAQGAKKHWTASTDDHQQMPYVPPPSGTPKATVERILGGG